MPLSTATIELILSHSMRGVAWTPPATAYVALYTVAPTAAGGGSEAAGTGYARQLAGFGAPSANQIANVSTVTFEAGAD